MMRQLHRELRVSKNRSGKGHKKSNKLSKTCESCRHNRRMLQSRRVTRRFLSAWHFVDGVGGSAFHPKACIAERLRCQWHIEDPTGRAEDDLRSGRAEGEHMKSLNLGAARQRPRCNETPDDSPIQLVRMHRCSTALVDGDPRISPKGLANVTVHRNTRFS